MKSSKKIRLGAVSYLNTKPLVYDIEKYAPFAEVQYDLPSRLAMGLAEGQYDVALIPSIEYFADPSYAIVSDACIACRGPVLSVKLFSRVPFEQIRSLALDEGSRTSASLVRILLRERFAVTPMTECLPIGADASEAETDAVLLIGDRAIHSPSFDYVAHWDLGEQWCKWAGLPFVFAMWVGRSVDLPDELARALAAARDSGVKNLEVIAQQEATKVGLSVDACLSYLRDNLYFYLGQREQRGLELFRQHAARTTGVFLAADH